VEKGKGEKGYKDSSRGEVVLGKGSPLGNNKGRRC